MKLSDKQKKQIITEYAQGGISKENLAKKYKVCPKTIYNVVKSNPDFTEYALPPVGLIIK